MQEKRTVNAPVTIDGKGLTLVPTPPRRILLSTLENVRREMARVYRNVDAQHIDSGEGSRRIYMLSQIGKLIEGADIESRIFELESRQEGGKKNELS